MRNIFLGQKEYFVYIGIQSEYHENPYEIFENNLRITRAYPEGIFNKKIPCLWFSSHPLKQQYRYKKKTFYFDLLLFLDEENIQNLGTFQNIMFELIFIEGTKWIPSYSNYSNSNNFLGICCVLLN